MYPVLRPPNWGKPFHISFDASNVAVGSVVSLHERKEMINPSLTLVSN